MVSKFAKNEYSLTLSYFLYGLLFLLISETTALPGVKYASKDKSIIVDSQVLSEKVEGPLTQHFTNWLINNGYGTVKFNRPDLGPYGSYGGKIHNNDKVTRTPVVFIHGNSDGALAVDGPYSSGYSNSIAYFLERGYTSAELYATTWGDRNSSNAHTRVHSCRHLTYLKLFIEAVLAYTNASQINIIAHSMGVTLARRVLKGGIIIDYNSYHGYCVLGTPLGPRVNAFIALSGANTGMCTCAGVDETKFPTCNKQTGFWPGDSCGKNNLTCGVDPQPMPCSRPQYSSFLEALNSDTDHVEGDFVASMWSKDDDILGHECNVYSYPTPLIPNSNYYHVLSGYNHMETKDKTARYQYNLVTQRKIL